MLRVAWTGQETMEGGMGVRRGPRGTGGSCQIDLKCGQPATKRLHQKGF